MKTTALPVSRRQLQLWSGLIARLPDFIALTKPRAMALAVFTAAVGVFVTLLLFAFREAEEIEIPAERTARFERHTRTEVA